jgi:hypothetical protein
MLGELGGITEQVKQALAQFCNISAHLAKLRRQA